MSDATNGTGNTHIMGIFTGTYPCKIDGKSRTSLPADFRDSLGGDNSRFFLLKLPNTKSIDGCDETFMENMKKSVMETYGLFSPEEQRYKKIFEESQRIALDSTGRFIIPEKFKLHADLKDKAIFTGSGNRFQMWSEKNYNDYIAQQDGEDLPVLRISPAGGN